MTLQDVVVAYAAAVGGSSSDINAGTTVSEIATLLNSRPPNGTQARGSFVTTSNNAFIYPHLGITSPASLPGPDTQQIGALGTATFTAVTEDTDLTNKRLRVRFDIVPRETEITFVDAAVRIGSPSSATTIRDITLIEDADTSATTEVTAANFSACLLYTSPSPRDS